MEIVHEIAGTEGAFDLAGRARTHINGKELCSPLLNLMDARYQNLIAGFDNEELQGMIIYTPWDVKNHRELDNRISFDIEDLIFDEKGNFFDFSKKSTAQLPVLSNIEFKRPISYVTYLQSFSLRKGVGTALVKTLQESSQFEGIILYAVNLTELFYEKLGFEKTGLRIGDRRLPILFHSNNKAQ